MFFKRQKAPTPPKARIAETIDSIRIEISLIESYSGFLNTKYTVFWYPLLKDGTRSETLWPLPDLIKEYPDLESAKKDLARINKGTTYHYE